MVCTCSPSIGLGSSWWLCLGWLRSCGLVGGVMSLEVGFASLKICVTSHLVSVPCFWFEIRVLSSQCPPVSSLQVPSAVMLSCKPRQALSSVSYLVIEITALERKLIQGDLGRFCVPTQASQFQQLQDQGVSCIHQPCLW